MDLNPNDLSSTSSTSLPSSPEDKHRITMTRVYSMQDPCIGRSSIYPWPSGWELTGLGIVTVAVKAGRSTVGTKEEDEVIPEYAAVCGFCFHGFAQDEHDVMKTKCKCRFFLAHEECASEWWGEKGNPPCEHCDQDMEFVEVSLERIRLSPTPEAKKGKIKRSSSLGRFLSNCTTCFGL